MQEKYPYKFECGECDDDLEDEEDDDAEEEDLEEED